MINNKFIILSSFLFILFVTVLQSNILFVNAETDYAISPVSLLLPYSTSKYRKPYKLEANKGCFEWINTNPDLVEITPLYEQKDCAPPTPNTIGAPDLSWDINQSNQKKCSKAVLVLVRTSTSTERNSAFIYAEEQATGKKLQCEVFVDKISSIVIETTTKTMYKDDLEELNVRAYDSVGNVFSSIIGLEFEWSIQSGNIIQIVPFRGFPLDDVALKMEQEGLQTSFVLVQGVDTGSTQITTKLTDSNFAQISHSTTISILEPLQLNPSYLLYVIPGTQIQYQLLTKKRTVLENIPLPNPNYIWSSSNPKVGNIDNSGNFMALDLGRTDLKVQHKKMMENKVQAFVNVVHPSYLAIKIEPIKSSIGPISNWNLIEKRDYILVVELYDASGHKIHSSDITFDLVIPSEYFEPLPTSVIPAGPKRSDTYYLKAIKQGSVQLKASLLKVYDINLKKYSPLLNPITVEQMVTIHSQITLNPPIVYLPYLPNNKQTYTIRPSGGSGEYHWYSNNTAIVTVDTNGGIISQTTSGQTEVIVVDKKNPHNRDQAVVIIQEPDQIVFSPSQVEVEVGKKLSLSTKLLSKHLPKGIHFDSCSINNLEWKVEDDKSFQILPQDNVDQQKKSSDLCSTREFLALKEGSTVISVQYKGMKEDIRIFAYPPLKSDHNEVLLSLGSSDDVYFSGGPEPWYLEPKTHFQTILPDNTNEQNSLSITPGNGNSFKVTCLKHSNAPQNIIVTVGNKKSASNPFPAAPSINIPYYCRQPSSIQIQVVNLPTEEESKQIEQSSAPSCQDTIFSIKKQKPGEIGTYKIRNNRDIPFIATVYDENGKQFTNYSSLVFDWTSSDSTQAKWLDDFNTKDHLSTLSLSKEQGKAIISVAVSGYNQELLRSLKIYSPPSLDSKKLVSSLELHLLSSVTLFPDRYTMYLNEKNHLKIEAIGGSKNFAFSSNTSKIASLSYQPNSDFVNIIPLQQGYIKVEVRDICLGSDISSSQQSSPAIVQVSEAHSIDLDVQDMVQVGDSINLIVKAFAQDGHSFESSQYQYMKILPNIDNPNVLSISQSSSNNQVFTLKGLDQGLVTLTVIITNPKTGFSATSKTVQIQVFPPFRVSPNILHLVPGGLFQIHWTGGAPIRQDVSFKSSNPSIVSLNQDVSGELLASKVGEATITATAMIVDPITGKKSIIGEDKLVVYVKNMTGIRIHSSINKILVGNEAKLRVVGANGETPFTYGTVDLFFKWECLDNNIATLLPIYERANTTVESEGSFSVRVLGKNPGSTSINVWAYSGSDKTKHLFQTVSLQINIIADIPIQTTSLLLPLNTASSFIINNHLDKSGIEFFPLMDGHGHSSCKDVIDISDNKIVSLDKIGTCYVSSVRDGRIDTSKLIKVNSKPFSHLEILPINPTSTIIPVGGSMSFAVYLRDDIGEIFTEYGASAVFSTEVSNTGVISSSIDSNTTASIVTVKGIRAGVVTLHVYVKDMPHLDDYIKIFVGRLIEPHSPILHIGSTIQFSISKDQLSQRGFSLPAPDEKVWVSSNPSIISIDPVTGKATAHSAGVTTVNYIRNPSSQTQITVSKVGHIKVDFANQVINNPNEKYQYNLKFFTENDNEFSDLSSTNQNIKGICSIQESSFANAYFEKIILTNGKEQYMCVVQPTGKPTSTTDKVTLFVQVSNSDKTYHFETTINLPFESTYSILNIKGNSIQLSGRQSQFILNVQSSNPIFVESSDNTLLSVQQLSSTGITSEQGIYKYVVQPMNPSVSFSSVPLYISSAGGKHKNTINVNYAKGSGASTPNYNESYIESSNAIANHPYIVTGAIIFATFAIGLYASKRHNDKPRIYISNTNPSQPSTSSVTSPFRSPPPHSFASPNRSQYGSNSIYLQSN
ncbi:hypothetical protein DICPUDRAFT_155557 [Dictyostelium purpureum]|uniref:BIG2 domain-containing protein n=1 Tax=Dictyostelium purpureum TaxID=5786 RepID=F0ZUB6_DICPU|nr:uncharacterized protein DICPUDRAFT_155557 [Dictyostelium purpureum]EGC32478.1 hypothetical protein DICPUDRAFT_155557 [Dictyostelium purpureum]|eukprot:XP_003291012.1 hypothetical protein DICPUDRAFT_155557 [Dictyostelium purpureum]